MTSSVRTKLKTQDRQAELVQAVLALAAQKSQYSCAGGNATANVVDGPFTITPSAAAGSTRTTTSNYNITYVAANNGLTVTPKAVTFTGSASKVYDGTTALSGVSVSTGVGSETLLLSNATANSADVGSGNFISAGTLVNGTGANGGLASNYSLPTTLDSTTDRKSVV